MLYFYQVAREIEQKAKEELLCKLKDNFHRHPKNGYIHELIVDLPQKNFADVMDALALLDERFQQQLSAFDNSEEQSKWMHSLLFEIDTHHENFGLDPQQTGNIIRHALRGMIYHHVIENGQYRFPDRYADPLKFLVTETNKHALLRCKDLCNKFNLSATQLTKWLHESISAYKKGLFAFGSLLSNVGADFLIDELQLFKIQQKNMPLIQSNQREINTVETFNTLRRLTLYSDLYWSLGTLFSLRAFIIHLNEQCPLLDHAKFHSQSPLNDLIKSQINDEETLAAAYNGGQQILFQLYQSVCKHHDDNSICKI